MQNLFQKRIYPCMQNIVLENTSFINFIFELAEFETDTLLLSHCNDSYLFSCSCNGIKYFPRIQNIGAYSILYDMQNQEYGHATIEIY